MMYKSNFVVAVRVNGKILRENQELVTLPFGAEYEILLKNLNSRRAMVKVAVDGQDATDGTRLILQPNSSVTMERFIKNGNLSSGNRFKFIERSAGIEAHRGIKEDDGLVRAEFWAEKEVAEETIIRRKYVDEYYSVPRPYYPNPPYDPWHPRWPSPWRRDNGITWSSSIGNVTCSLRDNLQKSASMNATSFLGAMQGEQISGGFRSFNDAGITVPGSESNQQFHSVSGFPLESNSHVIILQLRGEVGGVAVSDPITVDRKPECVTCGKVNKATNRFCSECGTALVLI